MIANQQARLQAGCGLLPYSVVAAWRLRGGRAGRYDDGMTRAVIRIRGARQNNLRNLSLDLPLGRWIAVTGVSGSGKSSLAFDTLYAEGQRRYVETFSAYARQFLDRMDKPQVDQVDGIPPAIAIDQTNPVRTSRSTVGTMTEINDHLKLLYARAATLYCRGCGRPVQRDTPPNIWKAICGETEAQGLPSRVLLAFEIEIGGTGEAVARDLLAREGYERVRLLENGRLEVQVSRLPVEDRGRGRAMDDLETALRHGRGRVTVQWVGATGEDVLHTRRFSSDFHCADCDIHYGEPSPGLFSFNSPIGACEKCRGFGRVIGIDYGLVVPDETRSLSEGAIKPWQSRSYKECQDDLLAFAKRRGVPVDRPWRDLTPEQRQWVIEGEGRWEDGKWYGVRRFFEWLEGRSYRMHVRVLLSRYRAYETCPACGGARLKPQALLWRLGPERFNVHELALLPLESCRAFFERLHLPAPMDEAAGLLLGEIRTRLRYLTEVGLGYLTLDRQSRTLSGGEVQRINLTTALGTALVNTLFVLDEPSIGLHPRDISRLVGVLRRLCDTGNTLVVVEHDPAVILAADQVLDLGPGPGERGGRIVFFGSKGRFLRHRTSATARGLRAALAAPRVETAPRANDDAVLRIEEASEHNLKNITVDIPLHRLVCVTGVSGSGKSTLIHDVCYRALRKLKGQATETPGRHRAIHGHERVAEAVLVDQAPIGKTARSNPASYVGVFAAIRKRLAADPIARARGYTAADFSFNAGRGRCPACGGNGFERVEMQFLSDVYARCEVCNGRRYRPEILEVKLLPPGHVEAAPKSVADVLDMTVDEAAECFAYCDEIRQGLAPLQAVGLGYVRLGQPVPTLSGGEAQRLKLAAHLAAVPAREGRPGCLFLLDEPTTGLHFDDIAVLLQALRALIAQGHSVVVIEHNIDVMRAADWIIDLGPEGGEAGGELVVCGPPSAVMACERSHTGTALRAGPIAPRPAPEKIGASEPERGRNAIAIWGAREHNLKNVRIRIPRERITVITGVSGSGKSTVAYDILLAEGQRRYLESLNAYARQFVQPAPRPDVDAVFGVPPTVAIEQRTSRGGRKSTVATATEIHHFLRLLFVKLGVPHCPECRVPIEAQTLDLITARLLEKQRNERVMILAPLVTARKGYYTDLARWAAGKGCHRLRVDGVWLSTDEWPRLDRFREHTIEMPIGVFVVRPEKESALWQALETALALGEGVAQIYPLKSGETLDTARGWTCSTRSACPRCGRGFPALDPRLFSYNSRHGWCPRCYGAGVLMKGFDEQQTGEEIWWNEWWDGPERTCPACQGARLRPEALAVRFEGRSIAEISGWSVAEAERYFRTLPLKGRAAVIARDVLPEIIARLGFLREAGLDYLSLDRAAPTLSGGEARRIRLAAQLGSRLCGVCYILDEPTIGLHARDNLRLLRSLRRLQRRGNTVVIVEHDEETIRQADHVIDLGPGAGVEGGRVVAEGTARGIMRSAASVTGRLLRRPMRHPLRGERRPVGGVPALTILGAERHNLRRLTARIPLGRFVCVTGVSGSGKSTLAREVLFASLREGRPIGCRAIRGGERIRRVAEVDQTPIGKTPRSCPATYVGIWDHVRRLFAATPEARLRAYGPSRFSFNVRGGRCEVCEGQGTRTIAMNFLPDVTAPCEACGGRRFTEDTLAIRFKEKTVAEVLEMSVDEAVDFFSAHAAVHGPLRLLQDIGLGYLKLGQPSPTLSGGEAQRIKLVTEMAGAATGRGGTLYLLDEPTVGLHLADVEKLLGVLHRLVDAGHTVVVIEHHLDVIAEADWVIDLGPEGGVDGGQVVVQGAPEEVARCAASHTGRFLAKALRRR